jgi:AAA15 family ATPase/GTPase
MKILDGITIRKYRNIIEGEFKSFGDLNILIGPNNCGKTTVLKSIHKLATMEFKKELPLKKENAEKTRQMWNSAFGDIETANISISINSEECYNRIGKMELIFEFNERLIEEELERLTGKNLDNFIAQIIQNLKPEQRGFPVSREIIDDNRKRQKTEGFFNLAVVKDSETSAPSTEKFSLLCFSKLAESVKNKIVHCEDARLQNYIGMPIAEYIYNKPFDGTHYDALISWLKKIVDPKIKTYQPTKRKVVMESGFLANIDELGSGVRSLICLISDIIEAPDHSIILIDEPELGLNPLAKQQFIDFLCAQSKEKQIFIASHDPTFTNPVLWKLRKDNPEVAIFLYSTLDDKFVKVNINESIDTAGSFAGYLPHTTSPKDFHLYVEGKYDVQIFKNFIEKYLWENEKWIQLEDRIGIYHLGGDFWANLVYTIPVRPYKRLLILDGDKRKILDRKVNPQSKSLRERILELYGDSVLFCEAEDLNPDLTWEKTVIYTLSKDKIEDYLSLPPKPKSNGPQIAHEMTFKEIPEEIKKLLQLITSD